MFRLKSLEVGLPTICILSNNLFLLLHACVASLHIQLTFHCKH